MPTKEEGPRIQQPEGTRRATEVDLAVLVHGMAPVKISGCDREWCEADTIFSPERGDLHFLFFLLCHKKVPFFSASTPALLLWNMSLVRIVKLLRLTCPPDCLGPGHCLFLGTQINPGHQEQLGYGRY